MKNFIQKLTNVKCEVLQPGRNSSMLEVRYEQDAQQLFRTGYTSHVLAKKTVCSSYAEASSVTVMPSWVCNVRCRSNCSLLMWVSLPKLQQHC